MGYYLLISLIAISFSLAGCVYLLINNIRLKKSLIKGETEFAEKLAEMCAQADQARQENASKSKFLANMSHELRTPLTGILGLSEVLGYEELTESQTRKVSLIKDSGQNLLEIVNDILDLSKIEEAKIELNLQNTELRAFLTNVLSFWKPAAAKKNVELEFRKQKDLPEIVSLDPLRLGQCLNNVINNALKFTQAGGKISVAVTGKSANGVCDLSFVVQDNGVGIKEEQLEGLFDPFAKGDDERLLNSGGAGLGLAISRELCRLMDGDLTATSVFSQGSCFRIQVRATDAPVGTSSKVIGLPPKVSTFSDMRILVVEDEAINRQVVDLMLAPLGLELTHVSNGAEAVAAVKVQQFDGVLMDIRMPVMNGLEATKAIRALGGQFAALPIFAMTANAMPRDRQECLAAGMNEHLAKPVTREGLFGILQEIERLGAPTGFKSQRVPT